MVMPYYVRSRPSGSSSAETKPFAQIMRHGTGLRSTHIFVVRLVRIILETGFLTALIAIFHLCLYFEQSETFLVPGLALSKLYANVMLVVLNMRRRDESCEVVTTGTDLITGGEGDGDPRRKSGIRRSGLRGATVVVDNQRLVFRLSNFDDIESTTASVSGYPPRTSRVGEEEGTVVADEKAHVIANTK